MPSAKRHPRPLPTSTPSLRWEKEAWRDGKHIVAGVDEAGRGAWAGPLVAAAVVLPRESHARSRVTRAMNQASTKVRDSKQLSADQRMRVMDVLAALDVSLAVAVIDVAELDAIGLGRANKLALCRAVGGLVPEPQHALVDAFRLDDLPCSHVPIIYGDNLSQSIAMASIVAKVHRDALMAELDIEQPAYGFAAHKGYGTALHRAAIERHGVSSHHRKSFAPIAELLARGAND